ncbi:MAG: ATP-binding protein [Paludibacteraceae bacterium]
MNNIIGRKSELRLLDEYVQSEQAEFVALYGRRRVGKTFLVEEYFKHHFAFQVTGVIDGTFSEQMEVFFFALQSIGYKGKRPKTWMEAFAALSNLLEQQLKRKRCVIFIDELPCFDTHKSKFTNAFGHFWNSWCQKHKEIMLIVCGSATTWMIKNLIDSHGGLHNRITHEMHISPFNLSETESLLKRNGCKWDRLSIMQAYMMLGGIPYYLNMILKDESVAQMADRLFFAEMAEMDNEYHRLFASLFRDPAPYLDIIRVLSTCKQGLTREEICIQLGKKDNGHLSEYLINLQKCDFIRYYYTRTNKVKKNNGLYQLIDFFSIFHNTFLVRPINDEHYWSHHLQSPTINTWNGLAFERVCFAHIPQIKKALGIEQIGTQYYSWRSKNSELGAQIDLLIERADHVINLCEIKYSAYPYAVDKVENMKIRTRIGDFVSETGSKESIFTTLITVYGLRKGEYSSTIQAVVTMDDLFKE